MTNFIMKLRNKTERSMNANVVEWEKGCNKTEFHTRTQENQSKEMNYE